jgi:hypothetical protein
MSVAFKDVIPLLEKYNESSFPILSVYINNIFGKKNIDKTLDKILISDISQENINLLEQNTEYIKGVLQKNRKEKTQSYAFFSGGNKLFEVIHLPFSVENKAYLSHSPFLEPILRAQNSMRLYLLVVLDRAQAKFFLINNGVIDKSEIIYDPSVPQKVRSDGEEAMHSQRSDKTDRHIKDHLNRHFKLIIEKLDVFVGTISIAGVIIGGHKTLFSPFEKLLPKVLQKKIVDEFVTEININNNHILKYANQIINKANRDISNQNSPYFAF